MASRALFQPPIWRHHGELVLFSLGHFLAIGTDPVIFEGDDAVLLSALLAGASGGIGGSYNVMPGLFVQLWDAVQAKDTDSASAIQLRINETIRALMVVDTIVAGGYVRPVTPTSFRSISQSLTTCISPVPPTWAGPGASLSRFVSPLWPTAPTSARQGSSSCPTALCWRRLTGGRPPTQSSWGLTEAWAPASSSLAHTTAAARGGDPRRPPRTSTVASTSGNRQ